jgi:hypothetical protein
MIISIDEEKSCDKIQHPSMIKALKKLRIEGIHLNVVKTIYDKPITNTILNGEKLDPFLLTWLSHSCVHSPHFYSVLS